MTARAILLAVVMAGCGLPGAPAKGSPCMQGEESECMTTTTLALCDVPVGKWVEIPCEGRCSNAQSPRCVWAKPKVGDACPMISEGAGACASSTELLRCRSGKWAEPTACTNCRSENGLIQCN